MAGSGFQDRLHASFHPYKKSSDMKGERCRKKKTDFFRTDLNLNICLASASMGQSIHGSKDLGLGVGAFDECRK